jgi:hypothetical protein
MPGIRARGSRECFDRDEQAQYDKNASAAWWLVTDYHQVPGVGAASFDEGFPRKVSIRFLFGCAPKSKTKSTRLLFHDTVI